MPMLDFHLMFVWLPEQQHYRAECALYDGDMYVASKQWENADLGVFFGLSKAFHLYWSRLYYDNNALTSQVRDAHGLEQLILPFPDAQ